MAYINIDTIKKNFDWEWDENSILYHISKYHSPKDVFDAVCFEINRYYSGQKDYKTYKKKVKWTGRFLNCEMAFWSSHSNMAGEYVNFEIVTSGYSNDISGMEKKGLLYLGIKPINYDVHDISYELFRKIIGYIDACVEFFKSIDSAEGFKKLLNEHEFVYNDGIAEKNRLVFMDKLF